MATALAEAKAASPATERVVVLMSKKDKAQLERKAREAGLSIGEYVRRAVDSYEPELGETAALELMVRLLESSNIETGKALDQAERALDDVLAHFAARRGRHGDR